MIGRLLGSFLTEPTGYAILMYHRLVQDNMWEKEIDPDLSVKLSDLENQMEYISKNHSVISLSEMVNRIKNKKIPNRLYFSVTFDDGYRDNYLLGKSVLEKHNIKATIFITAGFVGNTTLPYWDKLKLFANEQSQKIKIKSSTGSMDYDLSNISGKRNFFKHGSKLILNNLPEGSELLNNINQFISDKNINNIFFDWFTINKAIKSECFEIGCHTMTHPRLDFINNDNIYEEIYGSKELMQTRLEVPIELFSFPFGGGNNKPNAKIMYAIKNAGYKCSLMNDIGINTHNHDLFSLKRISVLGGENLTDFKSRICLGNILQQLRS